MSQFLPPSPSQCIAAFAEQQLQNFIAEVKATNGYVAYIPSGDDAKDMEAKFKQLLKSEGFLYSKIGDFELSEAIMVVDHQGRPSLWVNRDLAQYKCRGAFLLFLNAHSPLGPVDRIDGKNHHVDHAFNKARVINPDDAPIGDTVIEQGSRISAGYLRLFLIDANVNRGYGFSIEARRSRERRARGGFRMATWMVMLKLANILPPAQDELDAACTTLCELYGPFPYETKEAFISDVGKEMRFSHNPLSVIGPDRKIRIEDPYFLSVEPFTRSLFTRLIKYVLHWDIFDIQSGDLMRTVPALRIDTTERYYVADSHPSIVTKPILCGLSKENRIPPWENSATPSFELYRRLIDSLDDEVANRIKTVPEWQNLILDAIMGPSDAK